jgi:hypothetical protein
MTSQIADELVFAVEESAAKLRRLDSATVSHRPAPDRWTIKEVVGHLIDSCANNHQRFIRAQFTQELVFPKYDQNQWVSAQHYAEADWLDLLDLWRRYNLHLARVIRNVDASKLAVQCTIGDYPPVTLQFLIEDYVVHMKGHLSKIDARVAVKPPGTE